MSQTKLGILERLGFFFNVARTVCDVIFALVTSSFRGPSGHHQLKKHVIHAAVRRMNSIATARQLQNISPSTEEAYKQLARAKDFEPLSIDLQYGAKAHWFGDPSSETMVIWCHGGGYVLPASSQVEFVWNLQQKAPDCAAILLSYSLAPESQYPEQLKQVVALIRYLLRNGKRPEKVTIGGDSAGANLILALFSHILHPHPAVEPLYLPGPFRAAALVSPWVSFDCTSASYSKNRSKDCADKAGLKRWAAYFQGRAPADEYNQPLRASQQWWSGLQNVVSEVIVTAGTDETLFDDQVAFMEKLKVAKTDIEMFLATGETHDQMFIDPMIGVEERCESAKVVESWLLAHLRLRVAAA